MHVDNQYITFIKIDKWLFLIGGHEISCFDDIELEFVDFKLYVIY